MKTKSISLKPLLNVSFKKNLRQKKEYLKGYVNKIKCRKHL